jgi:hypothetical protein
MELAMNLHPGLRLESATCDTQVVVVRATDGTDVDLRCGGVAMRGLGTDEPRVAATDPGSGYGTAIGKRYVRDDLGLELLCTRGGDGSLTIDGQSLELKGAQPLPSSD